MTPMTSLQVCNQPKLRTSLRTLPTPDVITAEPWTLRTTKEIAQLLDVDPAAFTVWKYRGLTPSPEPHFFRGSSQVYRVDRIMQWLAQHHGQPFNQDNVWAEGLRRISFEPEPPVRHQVRKLVEWFGPQHAAPTGLSWRLGGFDAYLNSLAD